MTQSIPLNLVEIVFLKDLYVEALYTIVHKVGRCLSAPDEQLCYYLQQAFRMDDARHHQLLSRAHEEKVIIPNIYSLVYFILLESILVNSN